MKLSFFFPLPPLMDIVKFVFRLAISPFNGLHKLRFFPSFCIKFWSKWICFTAVTNGVVLFCLNFVKYIYIYLSTKHLQNSLPFWWFFFLSEPFWCLGMFIVVIGAPFQSELSCCKGLRWSLPNMSTKENRGDFVQWIGADMSIQVFLHLDDPSDLARVCSVSSSWRHFGMPIFNHSGIFMISKFWYLYNALTGMFMFNWKIDIEDDYAPIKISILQRIRVSYIYITSLRIFNEFNWICMLVLTFFICVFFRDASDTRLNMLCSYCKWPF